MSAPRRRDRGREQVLAERYRTVLAAEGEPADAATPLAGLRDRCAALLDSLGADGVWLLHAVVAAALPTDDAVRRLRRRAELDGAAAVLAEIEESVADTAAKVRVVTQGTVVDIHQLVVSPFRTGIQRVAHELSARWVAGGDVLPVRWTDDFAAMRPLTDAEHRHALDLPGDPAAAGPEVVVPWRARYVLPEVALDKSRTARMRALALHSRCATRAVVYDLVPIAGAETTEVGVSSDFSHQLTALRHFERVASDSGAATREYEGWRTMLGSVGIAGPEVVTIPLGVTTHRPTPDQIAAARARYTIPTVPLVLCVGSHEPRKNHLGVLHAARLLWQEGARFSLLFVGGNSWGSGPFRRWVAELTADGAPVEVVSGIGDTELWALYHAAHFTLFPSFSEGFGLPVVESLACGTPVVTSDVGAMRETAAAGGALLVDPRDHRDIAAAMRRLLTDDELHATLSAQARRRPVRTWDAYADEVRAALLD